MRNQNLIIVLFIALMVAMALLAYYLTAARPEPAELVPTPDPDTVATSPVTLPVTLFAYDSRLDTDPEGNVLCSARGLVPVARNIPKTDEPLKDTLALLFTDPLTEAERARGLTTEFPLAGVRLQGIAVRGDEVTIEIRDPEHRTSGGSCRVTVLRAQIEATARQFPEIDHVRFIPEGVLEP